MLIFIFELLASTSVWIQPPAVLLFLWFIAGDLKQISTAVYCSAYFLGFQSPSYTKVYLSFHFIPSHTRYTLLQVMTFCYQLAVILAHPLNTICIYLPLILQMLTVLVAGHNSLKNVSQKFSVFAQESKKLKRCTPHNKSTHWFKH